MMRNQSREMSPITPPPTQDLRYPRTQRIPFEHLRDRKSYFEYSWSVEEIIFIGLVSCELTCELMFMNFELEYQRHANTRIETTKHRSISWSELSQSYCWRHNCPLNNSAIINPLGYEWMPKHHSELRAKFAMKIFFNRKRQNSKYGEVFSQRACETIWDGPIVDYTFSNFMNGFVPLKPITGRQISLWIASSSVFDLEYLWIK